MVPAFRGLADALASLLLGRELAEFRCEACVVHVSSAQVNRAVRECLSRCYDSREIVANVAAFLEQLKSEGWRERDIHEVELAVLRVLNGLVDRMIYVGDATIDGASPTDRQPTKVNGV